MSLSTGVAEGPGAMRTLMSLLGAAGQGPPIFTRPVEVVGWAPADLAPQGVGATLGYYAPSWMDLHHQRGLVCWERDRGGHSGGRPPAGTTVPNLPALPKTGTPCPHPAPQTEYLSDAPGPLPCPSPLIQDHSPTYPAAGTAPLAHWDYPHILGHTCKEGQGQAVPGLRGSSASWPTWGASSLPTTG